MANHKSKRHEPHQRRVEDVEIPFVIAEVAVHPNDELNEPRDGPDQDQDAGDVDDLQEESPIPLGRQWHFSQGAAEEETEANTREDEEAKRDHLDH